MKSAKRSLIATNGQDLGLGFHLNASAFSNTLLLTSVIETLSKSPQDCSGVSMKNSFSYKVSVYLRIIQKKPPHNTSSGLLQEMKGIFAMLRCGRAGRFPLIHPD